MVPLGEDITVRIHDIGPWLVVSSLDVDDGIPFVDVLVNEDAQSLIVIANQDDFRVGVQFLLEGVILVVLEEREEFPVGG